MTNATLDLIQWPFWFSTPNSPDLGCLVEREHNFEVDGDWAFWMEFTPWEMVNGAPQYIPHQVYARVICGHAAFHQRVKAWMALPGTVPFTLLGQAPDHVLGGDFRPKPGEWVKFPVQSGPKDYWFMGEHRNPSQALWQADSSVGHSFDKYQNGTLSTVGWDDTGGDKDRNDLIMEVAVVYRRNWFDQLVAADFNRSRIDRFLREGLPRYRASEHASPVERK